MLDSQVILLYKQGQQANFYLWQTIRVETCSRDDCVDSGCHDILEVPSTRRYDRDVTCTVAAPGAS